MDSAQGTPDAPVIRRTKSGWGVSAGYPYYLTETKTRRAAQEWIDKAAETRAWLAEQQAADAERDAKWLAERGLTEIDYRQLQPGDSYAAGPVRLCPTVHVVTSVQHFDNGASLPLHDRTRVEELRGDQGCTLLTPSFPVYGVLRHEGKAA